MLDLQIVRPVNGVWSITCLSSHNSKSLASTRDIACRYVVHIWLASLPQRSRSHHSWIVGCIYLNFNKNSFPAIKLTSVADAGWGIIPGWTGADTVDTRRVSGAAVSRGSPTANIHVTCLANNSCYMKQKQMCGHDLNDIYFFLFRRF